MRAPKSASETGALITFSRVSPAASRPLSCLSARSDAALARMFFLAGGFIYQNERPLLSSDQGRQTKSPYRTRSSGGPRLMGARARANCISTWLRSSCEHWAELNLDYQPLWMRAPAGRRRRLFRTNQSNAGERAWRPAGRPDSLAPDLGRH